MSDDMNEPLLNQINSFMTPKQPQERCISIFPQNETIQPNYPKNVIVTSRYTLVNFFPKSLFEQFRRLANVYFLVIGVIAAVGANSSYYETAIEPAGILGPMLIVVLISVIKEGQEDWQRHRADQKLNSKPAHRVESNSSINSVRRSDLEVGDVVVIFCDEEIPADVLVLSCGGIQGATAYVETAAIDGETNLKLKSPCLMAKEESSEEEKKGPEVKRTAALAAIQLSEDKSRVLGLVPEYSGMSVSAEAPNGSIHRFNGVANLRTSNDISQITLTERNLLLRGSVLRATEWSVCLVMYTGAETKLSLNSKRTPSKLSSVDRIVNRTLLVAISAMIFVCFISMILSIEWMNDDDDASYLCLHEDDLEDRYPDGGGCESGATNSFLTFFTFATLYNNFVCISMYVSLEMVYLAQAFFLTNDLNLYDESTDTPAECHNSGTCADLGQVQYVLSDKTGTLTKNQMVLQQISIADKVFGFPTMPLTTENSHNASMSGHSALTESEGGLPVPLEDFQVPPTNNNKEAAMLESWLRRQFARVLVYCNTALLMPDANGQVNIHDYRSLVSCLQAESADEVALITAAAIHCGVLLTHRSGSKIAAKGLYPEFPARQERGIEEVEEEVELLAVNEFDSDRKMMSVLVRMPEGVTLTWDGKGSSGVKAAPTSRLFLLCKGADSSMLKNCRSGTNPFTQLCTDHIHGFANTGLRTLVLACKEVSEKEASEWLETYAVASNSILERGEKLNACAREIEKDMVLLGAVGIEDELQDGVAEALSVLHQADINVWMITGDKAETAVAIGKKCSLVSPLRHDVEKLVNLRDEALRQRILSLYTHVVKPKPSGRFNVDSDGTVDTMENPLSRISMETGNVRYSDSGLSATSPDPRRISSEHTRPSASASYRTMGTQGREKELALVVDGVTLEGLWANPELKHKFIESVRKINTVIACRVSPLQKAALVRMIKHSPEQPVTLAIGDGANDVGMIHESRVGVGISGKEGRHAANSADFAISQFRFIVTLMFDHGRYNYIRCSKLVLYSFFKNLLLVSTLFYYCTYSGFSGTIPLNTIIFSGFNFYLGLPILVLGAMDFDIPRADVLKFPRLAYATGRLGELLNLKNMFRWCLFAFIQGLILFVMIIRFVSGPNYVLSDGSTFHFDIFGSGLVTVNQGWALGMFPEGFLLFTCCVVAMQYKVVMMTVTPNKFFWFVWFLSFAGYILFAFLFGLFDTQDFFNVVPLAFGHPQFWLGIFVTPIVLCLSDYLLEEVLARVDPSSRDVLVEQLRLSREDGKSYSSGSKPSHVRNLSSVNGVALRALSQGSNQQKDSEKEEPEVKSPLS